MVAARTGCRFALIAGECIVQEMVKDSSCWLCFSTVVNKILLASCPTQRMICIPHALSQSVEFVWFLRQFVRGKIE